MAAPQRQLITLTGPGGIGKTRLAVEAASQSALPAYFVPLQPLTQAEYILTAIINMLPFRKLDGVDLKVQLLDYLAQKHLLLVLDNFEHLMDGVGLVDEIVQAAPGVRLLVTSREPLNLEAEWQIEVAGLTYPTQDDTGDNLSSVELFVERARNVKADFDLDAEREAVYAICSLVRGMPLAIEIAARWVKFQSCDHIRDALLGLENRMHDVPERHRTMRAVFNQSWHLLSAHQRQIYQRLSVFHGGFTAAAAAVIVGATPSNLAGLVDKSILYWESNGRYSLHELLRQCGYEYLQASGQETATLTAYSTYYAEFLRDRLADLKGRRQIPALHEIEADFENIRSAWVWSADFNRADLIDLMLDGLCWFMILKSREREGYELFRYAEQKIAPHGSLAVGDRLRGRLLIRSLDVAATDEQMETALQLARRHNDTVEIAFCLGRLSSIAFYQKQFDQSQAMVEESINLYRQVEDHFGLAGQLNILSAFHANKGTWAAYHRYGEEALQLCRKIGNRVGMAQSVLSSAIQAGRSGDFETAERLFFVRVTVGHEVDNWQLAALGHAHVCHKVYFVTGRLTEARTSAEAAIQLGNATGGYVAVGWGLATLALVAGVEEDYDRAQQLSHEACEVSGHYPLVVNIASWGLALAACGRSEHDAAHQHLVSAYHLLDNMMGIPGNLACLPIKAIIAAHNGQRTEAVELLALAYTHLPAAAGWMRQWPLLDRFQDQLRASLGEDACAAAWERGTKRDMDAAIEDLRAWLAVSPTAPNTQPDQPLIDPLTERELEILRLMADGLRNREIARRLTLSAGTVKWYTSQIYSKLGVQNRAQAVKQAHDLALLR